MSELDILPKGVFSLFDKVYGRVLFLNALSINPKTEVAMEMPRSEIMFRKRASS